MSLSEMIAETSIHGHTVEMWDHEGTTICQIEKNGWRSSLGIADDFGTLEEDNGAVHESPILFGVGAESRVPGSLLCLGTIVTCET